MEAIMELILFAIKAVIVLIVVWLTLIPIAIVVSRPNEKKGESDDSTRIP